jgi:inactive STAND
MNNDCELERWQKFLKDKCSNACLNEAEQLFFCERFLTSCLSNFDQRLKKEYAKDVVEKYEKLKLQKSGKTQEIQNHDELCRYYLNNVYGKLKFTHTGTGKDRLVFLEMIEEFKKLPLDHINHSDELCINSTDRLSDLLRTFNYINEEACFHTSVSENTTNLVLVEVTGNECQSWFTKRLIGNSRILENADRRVMSVGRTEASEAVGEFWRMTNRIRNDEFYQPEETKEEDVFQKIYDENQRQTIVWIIYNVNLMGRDEIEEIIQGFWMKYQKVLEESNQPGEKNSVLWLIGSRGWTSRIECLKPMHDVELSSSPSWGYAKSKHIDGLGTVSLLTWEEVKDQHLRGWLKDDGVFNFFSSQSGKSRPEILKFLGVDGTGTSAGSLDETLKKIYRLSNLSIANFEQDWKIMT